MAAMLRAPFGRPQITSVLCTHGTVTGSTSTASATGRGPKHGPLRLVNAILSDPQAYGTA
jgi:hypothetical protein